MRAKGEKQGCSGGGRERERKSRGQRERGEGGEWKRNQREP